MSQHSNRMTVHISPGSVFKCALVLIAMYAVYLLRDIGLVILTAVVIASAIEPVTKWFVGYKVPRTVAVAVIYVALALIVFGIIYLVIPSLLTETADLLSQVPQYFGSAEVEKILVGFNITPSPEVLRGISETLSARDAVSAFRSLIEIPGGVFRTLSSVFGGVFSFILIIVFSFYLSMQEKGIENFLKLITPTQHHTYAISLWQRSQRKIGQWMQGQLLLMVLVGVLVFLGLSILGVRHALVFAILAGLLELIPLFGPMLSSIPALMVGFLDGGVTMVFFIAGLYLIIQQFENHLIYPLVVNKVVGVPAMVVILSLVIGAELAGILGILLSVPIAAVLMELINDWKRTTKVSVE